MDKVLLALAKHSIAEAFEEEREIDKEAMIKDYPELQEKRAVFVTLNLNGQLRGCIGSLIPHRTLIDDVTSNARSAAFRDPRFPPLTHEEFKKLEMEISLLSIPYELPYSDIADLKSKIRPGVDGVILAHHNNQATFLPSVWEQLPRFEDFFMHLCQKAGLGGDCLKAHPDIRLYQAKKIH
ncbi:MAG: AmmeMemoRadiSam system protein A [Campylobacterota bacterium]|nr:AmmeMemoRadiSam system protein A [Campylobacterota bacterium]